MSKSRVETFSDAVFAIILTLLVLELRVPSIANHSSLREYSMALAPLIPKFVTFILSFVIISIHWVNHHYLFGHLKKSPMVIVWLNNLFLLVLCFMPFPTALLGDHPTDKFPIIFYAVNQLLAAFTFLSFRIYSSNNNLFVDEASRKALGPRHSIPAITIFTLSILFSFINVYLSLLCLLIVPLIYFAPNVLSPHSHDN